MFVLLVIVGCLIVLLINVYQLMSVWLIQCFEMVVMNGVIFQVGQIWLLFEDCWVCFVGDMIIIKIIESMIVFIKFNNKLDKINLVFVLISGFSGLFGKSLLGLNLDVDSVNVFSGKGEVVNNNIFMGNIMVMVIDVLFNGNLLVFGEKQLVIGNVQEFVRILGVINLSFVDFFNIIDFLKVVDVWIEYKLVGQISEGQIMGWLVCFFFNVMLFQMYF